MAASANDMSENNAGLGELAFDHSNPLTSHGIRLPSPEASANFQVHECGSIVHTSNDWHFNKVVSPFWRLYCDGAPGCSIVFLGRHLALGPTRAVIIPENVSFDCIGRARVPHMWLHFSIDSALGVLPGEPLVLELASDVEAAFENLRTAIDEKTSIRVLSHLCAGVLHLCMARLVEIISPLPTSPRMRTILAYIDGSLEHQLSNETLATKAGLSTGAFLRWFRKEIGHTPAAYVSKRRIREACRQLVFTDATIEDIAEALCFADRHHLSRVFRQHMGCGPAAFRRIPRSESDGRAKSL